MQISFKDKKVVIAGGSRGIGRSIALAFAAAGADVAICARTQQGLTLAEAELKRHGGKVFAAPCDLAEAAAVTRFVNEAAEALGGIDVLVNNASGFGMKNDESGWLASVNVDLMATVRATDAAIPYMEKAGGGAIINVSSISGLLAVPRSLPYAALKAAVVNYTMGQGRALAPKGIRVNAIAPGSIEFPGGSWESRKVSDPELYRRTLDSIPSGRFGAPEEIAKVALFLGGDMASWVTGQTIVVDGGQMLS
ncbi:SDR family NAD(P)-dependent oxidoreductase [Bosea sp. BK604]|uniref:SDR family NAD(P)-dependent oxidoreductase n=1 Tax=Bosea sp. BK604 TaxID=2512180 RepID=UPI00104394ED|nr:SDR family NAD(P)-dependent oxidoreductase [Bosea sp. BK604]TCR62544.1 3-oxoacyl-[acyl-carrier protein] reductase [Bosea sp. BK604]